MYVIKQFAIPFYACTNITSLLIYLDNYLQLGCCAQATLAAPAFANCPTTEPCTAPFSLSGDGGNTNGGGSNMNGGGNMDGGGNMNGGSNNSTNAGNGGSPSINSMATMFTSFLLATVALLFHS